MKNYINISKVSKNIKTAVLLTILLLATFSYAQVIFTESFTGTTFPPTGWTRYNFNGGKKWSRDAGVFYSAPGSAMCLKDARNNDWLITKRIGPINYSDSLIFYYNGADNVKYDTMLVRVSTSANVADTASYTTIFTATAKNNPTWLRKSLSLAGFSNQQVYIAFHYVSKNIRRIRLDDISVVRYLTTMYIINASAVGTGTITPSGAIYTQIFRDTTFTLQTVSGGRLDSLVVDGVNHGRDSTLYKFTNIQANHTITAYYNMTYWPINITVVGSGTVSKTPNASTYAYGSLIDLTANPSAGWTFTGWGGDASGNINPYSILVDTTKNVIAYFARDTFTINASVGPGGSISPVGLSYVPKATNITYTITPNTGYHILDVAVDDSSVGAVGSYTFTNVQLNHTIYAEFELNTHTLTVNTNGSGTVIKDPDLPSYNYGTYVKLTAVPSAGWHFTGWSGNLSGTNNPDSVFIDGNKTVTANFAINTYSLTVNINPIGGGTVTVNPLSGPYTNGTWVKLQATPTTGWYFTGWTDSLVSPNTSDSVYMNSDKVVTANFGINYYTLNITTVGNGTATKTPDTVAYYHGQIVRLDAYPGVGWSFRSWSGSFVSSANPEYILMNANKNLTATFVIDTFTITASASAHGAVTPAGETFVPYGGTQVYNITPDVNYHTTQILVDGSPVAIAPTYTFTDVQANHTISATFGIDSFAITSSAGANGSITPSGIVYVQYGDDQLYDITPNTGYHTTQILVDGSPVPITANYEFGAVSASHTISVTFGIDSFTITASSGANGSVTPSGVTTVSYSGNQIYNITPATGYHTLNILVDGSPVTVAPTYTFTNVQANHTISATFGIDTFRIIASYGANGYIMPSDTTYLSYGSSQVYNITPNTGYHTTQILVDGSPVAIAPTYTFSSVQANHTISATFGIDSFTITASSGANGSVTPSGVTYVTYNGSQLYNITPATGYHTTQILVDGSPVAIAPTYTFINVQAAHTISATFGIDTFTIEASASSHGSISPSGNIYVIYDGSQGFSITPDVGSHIVDVFVDGVSQGAITSHTFNNVSANHTIHAVFATDLLSITASAGPNGSISPSGTISVSYGASQSFSISANTNYHIDDVLVDGVSQGRISSFDFTNITTSHTIEAFFQIDSNTITASAGANGSISPVGAVPVPYNGSQVFNISPDPDYHTTQILVDASPVAIAPTYTFNNVTTSHTISATFGIDSFTITASSSANGLVTPSGVIYLTHGSSQTYRITPAANFYTRALVIDGDTVPIDTIYTFTNIDANHTIYASFARDSFSITASSGPNGSVTPSGATYVYAGSNQIYNITPATGYHTLSILVDGNPVAISPSYTFTNVTENHTISATFGIDTFTIISSCSPHGEIDPLGVTYVTYGGSQTYTITANYGDHISQILVDGSPVTIAPTYTFTNVQANHTIHANFIADTFTITASSGPNGSVTPTGITYVPNAGSQLYNITPNTGYHITQLLIDGSPVPIVPTYEFINVHGNHTISATFGIDSFTITASSGAHGSVIPVGITYVTYGGSQTYNITPMAGFHTIEIMVDGSPVTIAPTYTFTNVQGNHTINATFGIDSFEITASAGPNGSVTPAGVTIVTYGGSQAYDITPNPNYHTIQVLVDGIPVTSDPTNYVFSNVTADHTISATFGLDTFTIMASAGPSGSVTPTGATYVEYGSGQLYNITPDLGHHITQILVDGVPVLIAPTYEFTSLNANHTIHATFGIDSLTISASAGPHGIISPSGSVIVTYGTGQRFVIMPNIGYHIVDVIIDGDSYGPLGSYEFTNVIEPHTISAVFAINTYALNISIIGNGSVSKNPDQLIYDNGTWVHLNAIPELNWAFVRWTGDLTGRASIDSVLMTSDHNITAMFADVTQLYTLNVDIIGNGQVLAEPNQPTYAFGTWVKLTATAADDWTFAGWSSEYFNSTNNPDSLDITGNTQITATFAFTGITGWVQKESVPVASDLKPGKRVKDGGALVAVGYDLYAFHGNKSWKFFKYSAGEWDTTMAHIPFGLKYRPGVPLDSTKWNNKKVGKGGALAYDGANGIIYAVKGNNTYEFWAYDVAQDSWYARAFVPTLKKPKGGTSLVAKNGITYMLVGGVKAGTPNFFAYNPVNDSWTQLANAITDPDGKQYKDGSAITVIDNTIYALKGNARKNYFYAYDIVSSTWSIKETLPYIHPRLVKKNKVKAGGALTTDGENIYAIKGGGRQDFWMYIPGNPGVWVARDIIPLTSPDNRKSVPKNGAGLAYADHKVWLMKGNNGLEFWRYAVPAEEKLNEYPTDYTATATNNTVNTQELLLSVMPNPIANRATIKYAVPKAGKVSIRLYNAAGRLVQTLINEHQNAGSYTLNIENWSLKIARGIYFLKYDDGTNTTETKLIMQ